MCMYVRYFKKYFKQSFLYQILNFNGPRAKTLLKYFFTLGIKLIILINKLNKWLFSFFSSFHGAQDLNFTSTLQLNSGLKNWK